MKLTATTLLFFLLVACTAPIEEQQASVLQPQRVDVAAQCQAIEVSCARHRGTNCEQELANCAAMRDATNNNGENVMRVPIIRTNDYVVSSDDHWKRTHTVVCARVVEEQNDKLLLTTDGIDRFTHNTSDMRGATQREVLSCLGMYGDITWEGMHD